MKLSDIIEATLNDLSASTVRAFDSNRKNEQGMSISSRKITPEVNNDGHHLLCDYTIRNNKKGNTYECKVLLQGVEITEEQSPGFTQVMTTSGQKYIKPEEVQSLVSCTCQDFRHRFADVNSSEGALFGQRPPTYVRKTDNHQPVNPSNAPGLCKHLETCYAQLKMDGITL